MRHRFLTTALHWLAAVLVLRVLAAILANYPDYFPPDFDALFLQGREATFAGGYRVAFYAHILSAPVVLLLGLVLTSGYSLRRRGLHRVLGRAYVGVLLGLVLPSAAVMARHAFGGRPAGVSFLLLTAATAGCAVAGVAHARRGRYDRHRVWMVRCYLLVCSAVALRLTSGAAGLVGVPDPERAYVAAAWASWLVPLAGYEVARRVDVSLPVTAAATGRTITPAVRGDPVRDADRPRVRLGLGPAGGKVSRTPSGGSTPGLTPGSAGTRPGPCR